MAGTPITLAEETALRVRELEVKFHSFETENKMSDCYFNELDEELEEGRVSLEKLEKRVTALEIDLPELFEERFATLKTENAELRIHLNLVVDAVNNITRVWNEQVDQVIEPPDEVKVVNDDESALEDCQPVQQNPYVPEPDVFLPTFPSSPHPEPY